MTDEAKPPASPAADAKATLEAIEHDIGANAPSSTLAERLKGIEDDCANDPALRPGFLRCRGIVLNRLGLWADALGDLHEAKGLLGGGGGATDGELAAVCREIARVQAWRGEGREAALALLQAFAASGDAESLARAALESGRLHLEIGRLAEARLLIRRALDAPADSLPPKERIGAETLLAQTLVSLGHVDDAERVVVEIDPAARSDRIRHLLAIESARIALHRGDTATAARLLGDQRGLGQTPTDSFEDVELCEAEAELATRLGDHDAALEKLRRVISRFAEDDLAGREIVARRREADVLGALKRDDDVAKTLLAALHRAVARNLSGFADAVRAELAKRSVSVLAWSPGAAPESGRASLAGERFVRRRPLGEGGFGSVSRAYDLETGEEVALKRLRLSEIYEPQARAGRLESARHEAVAASRLQHPGIGRVYGLIVDEGGDGLLVRELVEGPTLRESIQATALPHAAARQILTEFAQAVAAIHAAGIVHHDLKPENIVLRGGRHPVVIDFGASSLDAQDKGEGFSALYAAPEQIAGGPTDLRADLFAVSMIFGEVLLGQRPERAGSGLRGQVRAWRRVRRLGVDLEAAGLPEGAARFLERALDVRPSSRPADIAPLLLALQSGG